MNTATVGLLVVMVALFAAAGLSLVKSIGQAPPPPPPKPRPSPRHTESPAVMAVISAASIAYVSLPLLVMGTAFYVAFFSHLHWFLRLVAGIACVPLLTVIGAVIVAIFAAGLKSVNTPAQPPKLDADGQPIDRR